MSNLRRKVLKDVVEFYQCQKGKDGFIPGKSKVPYAGRVYNEKELVNLVDASLDFWLTTGRYSAKFEKDLAEFLGIQYCLLTNSGSSANLLAISALTSPQLNEKALRPGDEIITTACGFPTTLNPILQNNLVPVFVDVELGSYNIDVRKIERAITKKTGAIFVPHTLGNPVAVARILELVKKYDLWFVEDNCDALGSKVNKRYTGTFGHMATCSFYPAHHITMGEGGAVLTHDPQLHRILLSFRDWGRDCWCGSGSDNTCGRRFSQKKGDLPYGYDHKYVYSHIGYNLKVTDMQSAVGVAQLKKLPKFIKARRRNFDVLYRHMTRYEKYFILPEIAADSEPSWFGFPLLVKETAPFRRSEIVGFLEKNLIATRMLFGGNLTKQPAYQSAKYRVAGGLSRTDQVMNDLFWLGVYPGLTRTHLSYIRDVFDDFMKRFIE